MSDDEEPDFDINNYGIDELLQIFGINSPIKKGAIMKIAAEFIEKYKKLKQSSYVEFFSQAMNKLVSNYNLVEGILGKVDEIMEDVIDNKEKIEDLKDKEVEVWNGKDFSRTTIFQTSEESELIEVHTSDGSVLTCTKYHKFYIQEKYLI